MSEGDYSRITAKSDVVQGGISFKGITVAELSQLITASFRHMLYKVKEYNLENKKLIYLSGESIGENAHYLLTVIIQDYKGLTQVVLRAYSNKKYGLNGFINEKSKNIRHLVEFVQSAKEIGIIENKKVINIIDSVLQRTKFEIMGDGGTVNVNVKESLMIRNDIEGFYSGNKVIAPILDNKQSSVTGTDVNFDTIGNVQTL